MDDKAVLDHILENYKLVNGEIFSIRKKRFLKYSENKRSGYYAFFTIINKKRRYITYHRAIYALFHKKLPKVIDHINRNRKDNNILNLRECTTEQNAMNKGPSFKRKNNKTTSIYKGVSTMKNSKKFRARIKNSMIGIFKTEEEAAIAYNIAAKEAYGEFAYQNIIQGDRK